MKNMKISQRLTIGFGCLIVLILALSIFSAIMTLFIEYEYTYLVEYPEKRANILLELNGQYSKARQAMSHMSVFSGLPNTEESMNNQIAVFEAAFQQVEEKLNEYERLVTTDYKFTDEEKNTRAEKISNIRNLLERYKNEVSVPVIQTTLDGLREETIEVALSVKHISDALLSSVEELTESAKKLSDDLNASTGKRVRRLIVILIVFSAGIIATGVVFAVIIAKSIISGLKVSVNTMQEVSVMVEQSSKQLNQASSQLANGAASQAASVQETSATMNETASMIQQTKDHTNHAANLSLDTEHSAVASVKDVENLMSVMNKLSESSMEINKIADAITTIASQTNILALNASVEAVRVGEAGKGFAVVAEEVRTLSIKSSEAASNTAKIIKENIELAVQGLENSKSVSDSLNAIFSDVQKVSTLLTEIAKASEEQSSGVNQIASAVSQMEHSTQSNAAIAEQSSAAADDLMNSSNLLSNITENLSAMI